MSRLLVDLDPHRAVKGRAFDRNLEVGPGKYKVRVQGAAMGGVILKVDDWSLTIKRVKT